MSDDQGFSGFRECPCCEGHGQLSAATMAVWHRMEKALKERDDRTDEIDRLRRVNAHLEEQLVKARTLRDQWCNEYMKLRDGTK